MNKLVMVVLTVICLVGCENKQQKLRLRELETNYHSTLEENLKLLDENKKHLDTIEKLKKEVSKLKDDNERLLDAVENDEGKYETLTKSLREANEKVKILEERLADRLPRRPIVIREQNNDEPSPKVDPPKKEEVVTYQRCPECKGRGSVTRKIECPRCHGEAKPQTSLDSWERRNNRCRMCCGSGGSGTPGFIKKTSRCERCDGHGRVRNN